MIPLDTVFRLIVSPAASAIENMATDEALLRSFRIGNRPILRLYSWQNNAITIGVSQQMQAYRTLSTDTDQLAKRVTGGGVLFHGHDISYALVLPGDFFSGMGVKASYEYLGQFLLAFYRALGLHVGYVKDAASPALCKSDFCQEGVEAYDIVSCGLKLGGNAQRRSKKTIFQHGSIPLTNPVREKSGTSLEAFDINLSYDDAMRRLAESFTTCFGVTLHACELRPEELCMKATLLKEKYAY